MRTRHVMVGAALVLILPFVHASDPPSADKARIAKLITQLGSDSYLEREQARKELHTIGQPALAALRRAAHTANLETSRRASQLIRAIEEQALTAALLTPKRVHLRLKDVPVLEAVAILAKQSGCALRVDGDRTVLAGKTVTLDTGEVTFWEAIDRLGAAAGLVEKLTIAALPGDGAIGTDVYDMSPIVVLRANRGARVVKQRARPAAPPLRIVALPVPERSAIDEEKAVPTPAEPVAKAATPPILPGRVILAPGTPGKTIASYAGAVRVLLKHPRKPAAADRAHDLVLAASAEPRLLGFTLVGVPTVARAIDEHGQVLSCLIDPESGAAPPKTASPLDIASDITMPARSIEPSVTIRLQAGAKPAKRLRELSGYLAAQVFVPNTPLVVVDDLFKAKGKSVHIKGGGRLVVDSIDQVESPAAASYAKNASGDRLDGNGKVVVSAGRRMEYRIVCKLDGVDNSRVVLRNGRVVNVNSGPLGGDCIAELRDAQGHRLTVTSAPEQSAETDAQGQVIRTFLTMQFRREAGQGEPVRLLLIGTHVPTIHVPFRFENVPLR